MGMILNIDFTKNMEMLVDICKLAKTEFLICTSDGNSFNHSAKPEYYVKKLFDKNPFECQFGSLGMVVETAKIIEFVKASGPDATYSVVVDTIPIGKPKLVIINNNSNMITVDKLYVYLPSPAMLLDESKAFFECNFKETEQYQKYYELRADDGIFLTELGDKIISLYSGLLNDTKADKIHTKYYKYDESSFIALFSTIKKKFTVHTIIRYLDNLYIPKP